MTWNIGSEPWTEIWVVATLMAGSRGENARPRIFGPHHLIRRDVEVAVIVEGMADRDREQRDEADGGEPPDVPDQAKPITVARPARMMPVPVLDGMWIGLKPVSGRL